MTFLDPPQKVRCHKNGVFAHFPVFEPFFHGFDESEVLAILDIWASFLYGFGDFGDFAIFSDFGKNRVSK